MIKAEVTKLTLSGEFFKLLVTFTDMEGNDYGQETFTFHADQRDPEIVHTIREAAMAKWWVGKSYTVL